MRPGAQDRVVADALDLAESQNQRPFVRSHRPEAGRQERDDQNDHDDLQDREADAQGVREGPAGRIELLVLHRRLRPGQVMVMVVIVIMPVLVSVIMSVFVSVCHGFFARLNAVLRLLCGPFSSQRRQPHQEIERLGIRRESRSWCGPS